MIPKGWKQAHIKEVGTVVTGSTPPTKELDNYGDEYMFVSPADMGSHKYIRSSAKMVSKKGFDKGRKIPPRSTLFTCIGSTIGKIGMNEVELITNQQINSVIPNSDIDPDFIYYSLENVAQRIKKLAGHQAVPLINKSDFEEETISLPVSKNEQEKIAKILSTWDEAIEKLENVLTKYEIRFEAVAKKLFKATNFAELSEVCEIKTGKKDVNEGNPNGAYPFFTCAKEITYSDNYSFDTTAVLVSGNGVGVGYCHYYQGKFEAYQRTYVLSKFKSGVNPQFIYFYLNFYLRKEILRQKQDTAMPYIKIGLLNSFKVPNIDEVTQNKICTVLNDFNRSTQIYSALLSNIKLQKQGLMQQLLTGKKRVKV